MNDKLDALLRGAMVHSNQPGDFSVSEQDLLAYLDHRADDDVKDRVRRALAESPELRRQLLEIAADNERLHEIVAAPEPWAASRRAARRPRPMQAVLTALEAFFRQPALVTAAAAILLMAYPSFRYLSGDGSGPLVGPGRVLQLDAGRPTLRGGEVAQPPAVQSGAQAGHVTITLWSESPYGSGETVDVEVRDGDQVVWRATHWPVDRNPAEPERIDLRLDTRKLKPGLITIEISRNSGSSESYYFELK